ncbi:MAG: class I SAM-dependent methyltransferase [Alphaproteobacteria bacterium]|nr:class I SAM-dependent methyltransferase [Alphaproteobacteria bacterium]
MKPLYDKIGVNYSSHRRPDDRIAAQIHAALGDAETVLNVGAGTGAYEPSDRIVTAVEPSTEMISQRPGNAGKVYQGVAEDLPFSNNSFDTAMAVLTVHHWSDVPKGLEEMRRVATHRVVILTFDPAAPYFWLADYIPEIIDLDQPIMPAIGTFERFFQRTEVQVVPVPHDCTDGFLGAYWRRPEAYLDSSVRAAISTFAKLDDISPALERLEKDLQTGVWAKRYADIQMLEQLDIGYRLVVADLT